jgi:hypothetical protein
MSSAPPQSLAAPPLSVFDFISDLLTTLFLNREKWGIMPPQNAFFAYPILLVIPTLCIKNCHAKN